MSSPLPPAPRRPAMGARLQGAAIPAPPLVIRTDTERYLAVRFLTEIMATLILVCITTRYNSLNTILLAGWLGLVLMLLVVRRIELGHVVFRFWWVLGIPLLAVASTGWSPDPATSLRYSLQLLYTALAGVLIARSLPPSRLVLVLYLWTLAICIFSILVGKTEISPEGPALAGVLGSKNTMSFMGFLLVFSAAGALLEPRTPTLLRLSTFVGMLIGLYVVQAAHSATGLLMTVAGVGLLFALCAMHRISGAGRVAAVVAIGLVMAPLLTIPDDINRYYTHILVDVLHKDPGLTGRDDLWALATNLIVQKPLLGHGYDVVWIGSYAREAGVLTALGREDGRSFNFHNTYYQMAVDTGLVSVGVFIVTAAAAALVAARRYVVAPSVATTFFFVLFLVTAARSTTEALIAPFASHTLLLFLTLTLMFWSPGRGWDDPGQEPAGAAPPPGTRGARAATGPLRPPRFR